MDSFFRIVTSIQWEEAQITGIIPIPSENNEVRDIAVCKFEDLEKVCGKYFSAEDIPLALEFSPNSFTGKMSWRLPDRLSKNMTEDAYDIQQGILKENSLAADNVLNIYAFEAQEKEGKLKFALQGET